MSDYSESLVLPALSQHLYRNAPQVQIEVVPTPAPQLQNLLENGYIDLLLGNQDVGANTFRQELFSDEFVCLVASDHPTIKRRLTLKQFSTLPHVVFAPHGGGDRLVESALKRLRIERHIALRVPRIHAIAPLLHHTPYIATVPAKFAALAGSDLKQLKPPIDLPALHVMQYWHETLHRDPAHRWLRQQLHELCRKK